MSEYTSLPVWIDAAVILLQEREYVSGKLPEPLRKQLQEFSQRELGERVDVDIIAEAWRQLANVTHDPAIGLTAVNDYFQPANWHTVGLAMLCSSSLRDALERLGRYQSFLTDAGSFYIREIDGSLYCSMRTEIEASRLGFEATDFGMAAILKVLRIIYPGSLRPQQVKLMRPKPSQVERYYDYFECSVLFDQDELGFSFSLDQVDRVLPSANVALARIQDQLTEDYLAELKSESLARQVKRLIEPRLPSGDVGSIEIADSLHMSSRNLQRRLQEEGVSFKQLLSEVRQELSLRYLASSRYSISEIAYLLGFSDQSNFTRAFKRWFKISPSDKRTELRQDEHSA
ncbi:MAG: helix-turn-helix domain-containing protein [Cellvibrionaceae bacterium]